MLIYLEMIETPEDKDKMDELYQYYRNLMFSVARKIVGNDKDAEDAVGNAVVKIIENLEKISEIKCPKTKSYVVTIVKNKARDINRWKNRHPQVEISEGLQGEYVEYDGGDELTQCILKLPDRYRDWMMSRYGANGEVCSMEETAELFDLSMEAAYKLDQRAKKKLEELCKKEGIL